MIFFPFKLGKKDESLISHHRQYPCSIPIVSRAVFLGHIVMTGIKQGDTLFSRLVAPKSDASSIPRGLQGAHVPGTAEGANPTLGKAGPLIPPSLSPGTHLGGAPPAGVPRDPAPPRPPLTLGRSVPAERYKGAADAPGRRRQRAGRGRFPGRRGRASGGRTVTGGRPRRQVRAPAGRHGVPGERCRALPAAEGPAAYPGVAGAGERPGGEAGAGAGPGAPSTPSGCCQVRPA